MIAIYKKTQRFMIMMYWPSIFSPQYHYSTKSRKSLYIKTTNLTKKYKHSCGLYAVFHSERWQTPGYLYDFDDWIVTNFVMIGTSESVFSMLQYIRYQETRSWIMEAQTMEPMYLSIQPEKTGERIKKLLLEQGYTIREIQGAFGFENPQAIYKWLSG